MNILTPVPGRLDYIQMTPIKRSIEMDNWLITYSKDWSPSNLGKFLDECKNQDIFFKTIEKSFNSIFEKIKIYCIKVITSRETIESLCKKIITQLLLREEKRLTKSLAVKLLSNENFLKATVAAAFELVFFIENCIELNFLEIIKFIGLDLYEFWKIINPTYKFDGLIPNTIRIHFQTLDNQILTLLIWKEENYFKENISNFFKKTDIEVLNSENCIYEQTEFNNQSLFAFQ